MKKFILFFCIIIILSCRNNTIENFSSSIDYTNKAAEIINRDDGIGFIEPSDMELIILNYEKAYDKAVKVNINALNKRLDGFGEIYNSKFVFGLNLIIDGYNKNNGEILLKGQVLLDEWGDWYSTNIDMIRQGGIKI